MIPAAHGHELWWLLSWACVLWYSSITAYVAVRGLRDIRRMLGRLGGQQPEPPSPEDRHE